MTDNLVAMAKKVRKEKKVTVDQEVLQVILSMEFQVLLD